MDCDCFEQYILNFQPNLLYQMVLNANQNQEGKLIEGTDSEMIAAKSQDFSSQNGHSDMSPCCYYTQLLGLFFFFCIHC